MPVTVHELWDSRGHSVNPRDPWFKVHLIAFGDQDDAAVRAAVDAWVVANSAQTYAGLTLLNYDPEPRGGGVWYVTLDYRVPEGVGLGAAGSDPLSPPPPPPPPPPGKYDALGPEWSATTAGGTRKIYQSLETRQSVGTGGSGGGAPNFNRAIGVTKDGVEGVDIVAPNLEITYTARRESVSHDYLLTLHEVTGGINNKEFFHFPIGSVLFMGADVTFRQAEGQTVVYKFSVASGGDKEVAPGLTLTDVYGWDYVWAVYKEQTDSGRTVKAPYAAYDEQVYTLRDFDRLEIGGDTTPP